MLSVTNALPGQPTAIQVMQGRKSKNPFRRAYSLVQRTPAERTEKIIKHLSRIEGMSANLQKVDVAYTGKDVTRGLRTLYRTRSYGYVGISAAFWITGAIFHPLIAFAVPASLLPVQAFAEEWRTSERMIYRQKKQELIRSNEGRYWLNPESGKPQITIIKKSYATANMAKQSFKNYAESLWREVPELHPGHRLKNEAVKRPYVIPFYGKTHRFTLYTLSPTIAQEMFEKSCTLYEQLFGMHISQIRNNKTRNKKMQTSQSHTLNLSG